VWVVWEKYGKVTEGRGVRGGWGKTKKVRGQLTKTVHNIAKGGVRYPDRTQDKLHRSRPTEGVPQDRELIGKSSQGGERRGLQNGSILFGTNRSPGGGSSIGEGRVY